MEEAKIEDLEKSESKLAKIMEAEQKLSDDPNLNS